MTKVDYGSECVKWTINLGIQYSKFQLKTSLSIPRNLGWRIQQQVDKALPSENGVIIKYKTKYWLFKMFRYLFLQAVLYPYVRQIDGYEIQVWVGYRLHLLLLWLMWIIFNNTSAWTTLYVLILVTVCDVSRAWWFMQEIVPLLSVYSVWFF